MGMRGLITVAIVLVLAIAGVHAMHGRGHRWMAAWLPGIHGHH